MALSKKHFLKAAMLVHGYKHPSFAEGASWTPEGTKARLLLQDSFIRFFQDEPSFDLERFRNMCSFGRNVSIREMRQARARL